MNDSGKSSPPRGFEGIYGHGVSTRILSNLTASEKLPGTFMFSGPPGTGKLATAIRLSKNLLCTGNLNSLCDCRACAAIRTGSHPDVIVISQDSLIKVEEIREIVSITSMKLSTGHHRIIIIDRAENLTPASQNAALKALEEPGERTRYILVTDTPWSLLPTVRSRSYQLRFTNVPIGEFRKFASAIGDNPSENEVAEAIRLSQGRPGMYLRYRKFSEFHDITRDLSVWVKTLAKSSVTPSIMGIADWKEEFREFMDRIAESESSGAIPRGADAYEIREHYKNPGDYPVSVINWKSDRSDTKKRWAQGRKARNLAALMRRVLLTEDPALSTSISTGIRSFMEKIKFNCNFDLALEQLYFSVAGQLT